MILNKTAEKVWFPNSWAVGRCCGPADGSNGPRTPTFCSFFQELM